MTNQPAEVPTPRTRAALQATQGLFRAAASINGFGYHAEKLERENIALLDALTKAAETFERYTKMHADKGTDDGHKKAIANHQMAVMCRAAIKSATEKA